MNLCSPPSGTATPFCFCVWSLSFHWAIGGTNHVQQIEVSLYRTHLTKCVFGSVRDLIISVMGFYDICPQGWPWVLGMDLEEDYKDSHHLASVKETFLFLVLKIYNEQSGMISGWQRAGLARRST